MRGLRLRTPAALLALLALTGLVGGCAGRVPLLPRILPEASPEKLTEAELRSELVSFTGQFIDTLSTLVDETLRQGVPRDVRRRALELRVRMVPLVQSAAFEPDPQAAWLEMLAVTIMLRQHVTEGPGAQALGSFAEEAARMAKGLEDDLVQIGARFLSPQQLADARAGVERVSRDTARAQGFTPAAALSALEDVASDARLAWVVKVPMAPFRALEGVNSGAQAINDFNQTAENFGAIVARLPEQVRWQAELLLYSIEDRDTTVAGLAAFESLAESAKQASAAIDRLPDDLRTSLGDTRETLAQLDVTLASARGLLEPLGTAADQVRRAGDAWAALRGDGQPEPNARPFDIREWESTFREVTAAAAQLERTAVQVQALADSNGGQALKEVSASIARTQSGAQAIVDYAFWRLLALAVAVFALALAYRLLGGRIGARAGRSERS